MVSLRNRQKPAATAPRRILAALVFGFVAAMTLAPAGWVLTRLGLTACLTCSDLSRLNAIQNVLLFVPVGAVLQARVRRWRPAFVASALISLSIELAQTRLASRDPSAEDVILNTLGAAVGIALVAGRRVWCDPAPAAARLLGLAWAAAVVIALWGTAWLAGPTSLHDRAIFSQWAPPRPLFDRFGGRVLGLWVNELDAPHGTLERPDPIRAAWGARPVRVRLAADLAGDNRSAQVLLARLIVVNGELVMFARRGDAFMVRVALRGSDLGLRPPIYALEAPPDQVGPVELSVVVGRPGVQLSAATPQWHRTRDIAFDLGMGWVFLLPVEVVIGKWLPAASAAWLALLSLPMGFYLGASTDRARSARHWAGSLSGVGVVAAAMALIPHVMAVTPTPLTLWAGALGGGLLGWVTWFRVGRGRDGSRTGRDRRSLESRASA